MNSKEPINILEEYERVNIEWNQARREFLKVQVRFQVLENLTLLNEFPPELRRRPDVLARLTEEIVGVPARSSKLKLDQTTIGILNSQIRKILLARAITLLSHWPSVYGQSSNEYMNAATLPDLVRTDLDCLRSSRLASHNDYAVGPILERHFSVLATICHDHCLGIVHTYNSVKLEYNMAKKKTLALKLNCLHLEVLSQTYTHQANKALENIRIQILTSLKEVRAEVERLRLSIGQYQAIGTEFEKIVEKFAQVQSEIEGKKWALKELKSK